MSSRVTIHMAASLDGYVARKDGSVDWLETSDEYLAGDDMDPEFVETFLNAIDCYVMGSKTYEVALGFEEQGFGWSYGDKPTYVLSSRELPKTRDSVSFYAGELAPFLNEQLRTSFDSIWVAGGPAVCTACLRLGLADEISYSILPVMIGEGISFFEAFGMDLPLHLAEVKAYKSGMVDLRYEVKKAAES